MCPSYQVFPPEKSTMPKVHPGASATSNLSGVILRSKQLSSWSRIPPLRDSPRSEDSNSESEAPTTDHPWSPLTVCSFILPTFITCSTIFSADSYGQWQISRYAVPPNNASDHSRYNKFSTCRLCSYSSLSIPPTGISIRYIWSFFSKEGIASLILKANNNPFPH